MKNFYLDFEKPISDIMDKIEALKIASEDDPKLIPEIEKLKTKEKNLRKRIFSKLFHVKIIFLYRNNISHMKMIFSILKCFRH